MPDKKSFLDAAYALTDADTSETVKAMYDAWADEYDAELVDQNHYVMPVRAATAIAKHLADHSAAILDVGCGTGLSGKALRALGFTNIDGCDLSPGMLAKAAQLKIYDRLFEADLTQPPLDVADAHYDAVTVVGAFSFAHVPVSAMDDILRTVKSGGLMLITTNDHYYDAGTIQPKLDQLRADGLVDILLSEHGAHIEDLEIGGWVFLMRKH